MSRTSSWNVEGMSWGYEHYDLYSWEKENIGVKFLCMCVYCTWVCMWSLHEVEEEEEAYDGEITILANIFMRSRKEGLWIPGTLWPWAKCVCVCVLCGHEQSVCVRACVRACVYVRACVCMCVCTASRWLNSCYRCQWFQAYQTLTEHQSVHITMQKIKYTIAYTLCISDLYNGYT